MLSKRLWLQTVIFAVQIIRRIFPLYGSKFMDYKNDNRTPRDRVTGEFLSELLFTEPVTECEHDKRSMPTGRMQSNAYEKRRTPNVNMNSGCECRKHTEPQLPRREQNGVEITGSYSLAMAYVPMQSFCELYDLEEGFCQGTIFKELRFPFYPTPCRKDGN